MSAEVIGGAVRKPRWLALDLLRFIAVVLMVQGHTFYVVIEEAVRAQGWYRIHNYVHGYTAPLFLFGAGLAFGITTLRRWEDHTRLGRPLFKRMERYFWLVFIGYVLDLPNLSIQSLFEASDSTLRAFFKVDALQHIGVTMAICELLVLGLKRRRRFLVSVAVLGSASVLCAPAVWRASTAELPLPLAGYVNAQTGSIFPLLPWSGFIFAGILTAALMSWAPLTEKRGRVFAAGGAALLLTGELLSQSGYNPFGPHIFWKTSPFFFLVRIGVIWLLLSGLCSLERALLRVPEAIAGIRAIQLLGQESLVIYVTHLVLLYGSPVHRSLKSRWGMSLDLGQSIFAFLVVFLVVSVFAWAWNRIKTQRPLDFQRMRFSLAGVIVLFMLAQ